MNADFNSKLDDVVIRLKCLSFCSFFFFPSVCLSVSPSLSLALTRLTSNQLWNSHSVYDSIRLDAQCNKSEVLESVTQCDSHIFRLLEKLKLCKRQEIITTDL